MSSRGPLPPVTVVIPCFNQAQYLEGAVRSVREQRHPDVRCIVVDDGSTDETPRVAESLGVHLVRQRNRGVSEARNAGLAAATTEFAVFLDADDELLPDAVPIGLEALMMHPDAGAVVGRCRPMDPAGVDLPAAHRSIDPSDLYGSWLAMNFVWAPGAAMFRRRALEQIGGFPARLGPAADYAVYLQLARRGRVIVVPEVLARYRQHESSMSRDPALMLRATLGVLRRESREAAPEFRGRIRLGRSAWCEWYGEQIVDRLRKDVRAGRRGPDQVRALGTLLRHCPGVALRHARRKARIACAGLFARARAAGRQLSGTGFRRVRR